MDINTGSDADRISNLEHRVGQLEAAVAALQQTISVSLPPYGPPQTPAPAPMPLSPTFGVPASEPDWMSQVRALKMQGQEIAAIKIYRANTGVGLKEAKDYVEGMG